MGNRLYYELDEVVVYGQKRNFILNEGRAINDFIGNALYGFDNKQYKSMMVGAAFDYSMRNNNLGLNSIETMSKYIRPNMLKFANISSNVLSLGYGTWDTYQGYLMGGKAIRYNTTKAASKSLISWVAGMESAKVCATYGTLYGGMYGGIVCGIAGGIIGGFASGYISDYSIDFIYH